LVEAAALLQKKCMREILHGRPVPLAFLDGAGL
jgi:hypothetical protein